MSRPDGYAEIFLRQYRPSDCQMLANLFYDTIHRINIKDYSEEQVNAWANENQNLIQWNDSFLSHDTVIAEMDKIIVGFGDIDNTGYFDRLYVHADFQHQGIATVICNALEKSANVSKIITYASITARGFFEKRGYRIIKRQQVQRQNILLTNYKMILKKNKSEPGLL